MMALSPTAGDDRPTLRAVDRKSDPVKETEMRSGTGYSGNFLNGCLTFSPLLIV